jgi:hypothetical protein
MDRIVGIVFCGYERIWNNVAGFVIQFPDVGFEQR